MSTGIRIGTHASVAKGSTHGHRSRIHAPTAASDETARRRRRRADRCGRPERGRGRAGRRPPPRRRGRRAGGRVSSRRAGARDRGSRAGRRGGRARSAQRLPDEHGGARRVPVGGDRQREPPLLQRGARAAACPDAQSRFGRRASSGTRSASEETRTANGAPAAAAIRFRPSVTKRTATGIAGVRADCSRPGRTATSWSLYTPGRDRPPARSSRSRRSSPPCGETASRPAASR